MDIKDADFDTLLSHLRNLIAKEDGKEALPSDTFLASTMCGDLFINIVYTDESRTKVSQVLANLGKTGTCPRAHLGSMCELLTSAFAYMRVEDRRATLIKAAGHKCGPGVACFDSILRRLLELGL